MTWFGAKAWANSLNFGGFDDWRAPTAFSASGSLITGSTYSGELGHIFFLMGGTVGNSIATHHNAEYGLFNNVQASEYWSGTESVSSPIYGFYYDTSIGFQQVHSKNDLFYAWAVRDGDVSAVPIPAAVWLFGTGLVGLLSLKRRMQPAG